MPSQTTTKKIEIPRDILEEINGYVRAAPNLKYTEEMIGVLKACDDKNMRWVDTAKLMQKYYPDCGLGFTATACRKVVRRSE